MHVNVVAIKVTWVLRIWSLYPEFMFSPCVQVAFLCKKGVKTARVLNPFSVSFGDRFSLHVQM